MPRVMTPPPAPSGGSLRSVGHWVRLCALALALALVALLQGLAPGVLGSVERVAGDLNWRWLAAPAPAERRVVVVDIDERSLQEVGAWPWSRGTLARLSERLKSAGATVQVYDIVFPEPREGDDLLAAAWASAPVTAGQILSIDPAVTPAAGTVTGASVQECPTWAPRSHGVLANAPELARAVRSAGHLTPRVASDGVVRTVPALVCHQGRAYPSLALAALGRLAGEGPGQGWRWQLAGSDSQAAGWLQAPHELSHPLLPGIRVPLDERGDLRVPYRRERAAFASVSAADVLAGRTDRSLFTGVVVLVGATAFGLSDAVATPLSPVASGLEVHAQLLAGLLDQRLPVSPAGAAPLQWLAGLAVLALLFALAPRLVPAPSAPDSPLSRLAVARLPVAGAVLALSLYIGALAALAQADLWLPWAVPAALALLGAVLLATVEHALTRDQRERLFAHLGAYLPRPVARRLAESAPSGQIQVEQREVTVMVADIRNFSAFAAHRPPAETAALLHAFFSNAVEVIEAHGGVVENVVGDSLMAVWNAYGEGATDGSDGHHPAMRGARELLRQTRPLLEHHQPAHEAGPVQPLALGIGLESGRAVVGSFGPQRRRVHAALGEPVSVASRLQAMTQELSYPILVGPALAQSLAPDETESLGEYLLEGLTRHYAVFAATGWEPLLVSGLTWVPRPESPDEAAGPAEAVLPRRGAAA